MTKISEHIKNSKYMQVYIPRHVQEDMQLVRGVPVEWVKTGEGWVLQRLVNDLNNGTQEINSKEM